MSTSDPSTTGYNLAPPDPGLVNPDLALDAALAPVDPAAGAGPTPFGRAWRFDFVENQFVRDQNGVQPTYETDTLTVWIEKCLRTSRFAHSIYSDQFGLDNPYLLIGMQADDDELISEWQDQITAALKRHERITDVQGFSFNQDPFDEGLFASFTVTVDEGTPLSTQTIEFTNVPLSP